MNDSLKTKILIVEDHELARYGLVMALEDKGMYLTGEAENGQQGLDVALKMKPDVVLMDIGMPILDGIKATQQIKNQLPDTKILILTSRREENEIYASLAAGADAYCMKDIKIDLLCQVIEMVKTGAVWLDPAIARCVIAALPRNNETIEHNKTVRKQYNADLTEREYEVLRLIVDGKSNKEIAQILNVTAHTAKAHVCNIIQKLAVDDRTQAAVKALKEGLIEDNPSEDER